MYISGINRGKKKKKTPRRSGEWGFLKKTHATCYRSNITKHETEVHSSVQDLTPHMAQWGNML